MEDLKAKGHSSELRDEQLSKTPRTDALIQFGPFAGPKYWVDFWDKAVDSHRTLERDNSALRDQVRELVAALEEIIPACDALDDYIRTGVPNNQQRRADAAISQARYALSKVKAS